MTHTFRKIDDMEGIYGGAFKRARAELGIESFGMQVIDLPAGFDGYPAHDHSEDGQEEVYIVLRGSVEIETEGETYTLDPDGMLAIGPGTHRSLQPGAAGARMLVIGGVPDKAYEAPDITKLGSPDPGA